ncbi:MAG: type III pantothenate kinase [Planctomycetota bacterium]
MTATGNHADLLAVDIGNSLVKFGWFPGGGECETAASGGPLAIAPPVVRPPEAVLAVPHSAASFESSVQVWLTGLPGLPRAETLVASVYPEAASRVETLLAPLLGTPPQTLDGQEIGIPIEVDHPPSVGIDRLLCAAVAARLKRPQRAAIAATVGTAITVNLVSAEGAFLGGAILPGLRIAAESLHRGAAALPLIETDIAESPPEPLGRDTRQAIESGMYWGSVGGLRELVAKLGEGLPGPPEVFVTGGDGAGLARCLPAARFVPHMVLSGVYHAWANDR